MSEKHAKRWKLIRQRSIYSIKWCVSSRDSKNSHPNNFSESSSFRCCWCCFVCVFKNSAETAFAVVSFFLQKLGEQIEQERQLLSGVRHDVVWIKDELQSMKYFLLDADRQRDGDAGIEAWVAQVRRLVFRAEDAVDEFLIQTDMRRRLKNRFLGCVLFHACFLKRAIAQHRFGIEMQIIRSQAKDIDERRRRYEFQTLLQETTSSHSDYGGKSDPGPAAPWVEEADIIGIEKDAMKLQEWLLETGGTQERAIISIVGAGGIGKTTLVKKAYKDHILIHFECHAWVFVSQTFQTKDILKKMLKGFFKSRKETLPNSIETMEEAELRMTIWDYLPDKRYALVLDDIWDTCVWEHVKHALPLEGNGRIIFTTRDENKASPVDERCYMHKLEPLSRDLAWKLFCKKAFRNRIHRGACPKHLIGLAEAMVRRCKGLPLAIVAVGGLMSKKSTHPSEWQDVLENLEWELSHNQDLARLNKVLVTSYNYLPSHLKYCFLYCAMFPEDYAIQRAKLIHMWMAEGFVEENPPKTLEEVANDYFVQLIERNLLLPLWPLDYWRLEFCQLHDLIRDMAIHMFKKEEFATIATNQRNYVEEKPRRLVIHTEGIDIPGIQVSLNPRTLFVFSEHEFPSSIFRRMLLDFKLLRVLDLECSKILNLPKEIDNLIHLRYLSLKETGVEKLPETLQRLHSLQTLDVSFCNVKSFPDGMIKLVQLRHLYVGYCEDGIEFVKIPMGISNLFSLQSLEGVLVDDDLLRELGDLKQVRELSVGGVRGKHCVQLCNSISQLQHLRRLYIQTLSRNDGLQLKSLQQPPRYLEELHLMGVMEEFPQWIGALDCVCEIVLSYTELVDDPFLTLGLLPHLLFLILDNAYVGKHICFPRGGFLKLRLLKIDNMPGLEELSRIEEGTLQSLQLLSIGNCPKLKMLPDGLQHIAHVKELQLYSMPEEFTNRIKKGGNDHFKVQQIPLITYGYEAEGEYVD